MAVETAYTTAPGFTGRVELVKTIPVDPVTGTPATALPAGRATAPNSVPTTASSDVGTDRSITATTTSQQLMAANATRGKFFVKNDTAIDVWINFGGTAVATAGGGNLKVAANGGYYELTGYSGAVAIIAASTTAAVTAREI